MAKLIDPVYNYISNADLDLLSKAFKDENFQKCFREFANDISDPKTRNHYENELKKYENEKGVDVTFLHPRPGIALQAQNGNDNSDVFVNIAVCDKIQEPTLSRENISQYGLKWAIPLAISKPRLECGYGNVFSNWLSEGSSEALSYTNGAGTVLHKLEKNGLIVYDVIVSPLCIELSKKNTSLKNHLISTALNSIKEQLKVDLGNAKTLPFNLYVGNPMMSLVKTVVDSNRYENANNSFNFISKNGAAKDLDLKVYSTKEDYNKCLTKLNGNSEKGPIIEIQDLEPCDGDAKIITPMYELKHKNHICLQDYSISRNNCANPISLRPQALLLKVSLPGINSSSQIDVNASEKLCTLATFGEKHYALSIKLPYAVHEEPLSAKFDITTGLLEIEFDVLKVNYIEILKSIGNDNNCGNNGVLFKELNENGFNIDSESGYGTNSDMDKSSLSSHDDDLDFTIKNEVYKAEAPESSITNFCSYAQCEKYLLIVVEISNLDFNLCFKESAKNEFTLKLTSPNLGSVSQDTVISVSPNNFTKNGVSHRILMNELLILVEKQTTGFWSKIMIGTKMQDLPGMKSTTDILTDYNKDKDTNRQVISTSLPTTFDDQSKCINVQNYKLPLLPHTEFCQSDALLTMKIPLNNASIQDVIIDYIDSKTFKFVYRSMGSGFAPLLYGGYVCTAPFAFKNKGVSYHAEESLVIEIKKKKPTPWHKIKIGQEQKGMNVVKLTSKSSQKDVDCAFMDNEAVSSENENKNELKSAEDTETAQDTEAEEELRSKCKNCSSSGNLDLRKKSAGVRIPNCSKEKSSYFVTSSWPRGILKTRHRTQSVSVVDSRRASYQSALGSSLDAEDYVETEEDAEKLEALDERLEDGSSNKKSVRFNKFVCKQVFRKNVSILGQKAKNHRNLLKRQARHRRNSEGSQSSGTETETDLSGTETKNEPAQKPAQSKKKKKKGNSKSKNKKPILNISNDMVFQLDED